MKYSLKAAGIIEAMVVLLLLTVWVTWVYTILVSWQRLSQSTSFRIEAIQIARDGLEVMTNIRDTNWIEFWGDVTNCWNTWNYNSDCIWDTDPANKIRHHPANQSLIAFRDDSTWKFQLSLENRLTGSFLEEDYRDNFWVYYDDNWFYTQSWTTLLSRIYTREIRVNYLDENFEPQGSDLPNNPAVEVTVIVQWSDPAIATPRTLEMSTVLTNWKDRN